jgi:hypothetical protein
VLQETQLISIGEIMVNQLHFSTPIKDYYATIGEV